MAFVLNGTATAYLVRDAGLITATSAMTVMFAVKRTASQAGRRAVMTVRDYTDANIGHDVYTNTFESGNTYAPYIQANFGAAYSGPAAVMPLNDWIWLILRGNGSTLTISTAAPGAEALTSSTSSQTAVDLSRIVIGDTEAGENFQCKAGHIREYAAYLDDATVLAQIKLQTGYRTTDLVSAKSGLAANLAAALTGETGSAFNNAGAVTLDTDEVPFPVAEEYAGSVSLPLAITTTAPVIAHRFVQTGAVSLPLSLTAATGLGVDYDYSGAVGMPLGNPAATFTPGTILLHLSGGSGNTDPAASIGGAPATGQAPRAVFPDVTAPESVAGTVQYTCLYLHNARNVPIVGLRAFFAPNTTSPHTTLAIGLGAAGVNANETPTPNNTTAPAGITFSEPDDAASGIVLPTLNANDRHPIWLRRTTESGAAEAADSAVLRLAFYA